MRLSVLFAMLLLMGFTACKPKVPSEYIQPSDMEDILYDYHLAQAMAKNGPNNDQNKSLYFQTVLKKYDITEAEFDSSLVYYYSHVDRFKSIYDRVNERLADEAKNLGAAVGDINRYSQYSATGDTANIWSQQTECILVPCPAMNRFDFTVKADTSFRKGDAFMFQFTSEYIWQSGMKDAVVCLVSRYEGDSIVQNISHVSMPGTVQVRVMANSKNKLKEMRGFIYLSNSDEDNSDMRHMMFISQMQLIRFRNKQLQDNDISQQKTAATDSVKQGDISGRPMPDTLRSRIVGRRQGGTPLPVNRGVTSHRMDAGPVDLKKAR